MRLHFFTSKDVQRSSSTKDSFSGVYTNYVRKIDTLSNYNIIILIGAITLLLVLYSFIAYSFLESSSVLLLKSDYRTNIHTENSTAFKDSIDTHLYTHTHKDNTYSTTRILKNNAVGTVHTSFQKYLRSIQLDYTSVERIKLLCISKRIIDVDSNESLQNNNKTILS
ncbi:hypothetical protein [Aquimarina macrocephali]|uniref:hypothetical protein n=1 Tax=Aquimarina macrocephali TaxID=666563 RepID=UPI000465B04B|nr:hypothetical protein [Aquimarina macrocephali]